MLFLIVWQVILRGKLTTSLLKVFGWWEMGGSLVAYIIPGELQQLQKLCPLTFLAAAAHPVMLADAASFAYFAQTAPPIMFANAGSLALPAPGSDPVVLANGRSLAQLAPVSPAVVLADAFASALPAGALLPSVRTGHGATSSESCKLHLSESCNGMRWASVTRTQTPLVFQSRN